MKVSSASSSNGAGPVLGTSSASSTTSSTTSSSSSGATKPPRQVKHPRRYCRAEGCTRIVKSQGLCQRHGAKTRFCKVVGCQKQAQGSFNGMCKAHFNEYGAAEQRAAFPPGEHDPSVYGRIIPDSINWSPTASPFAVPPLIQYLQNGSKNPPAWHRNEERVKRGLQPVIVQQELDDWEQDLAFTETVICSGRPDTAQSLSHLAHAWGRKKDFHISLSSLVCHRRQGISQQEQRPTASEATRKRPAPPSQDKKQPPRRRPVSFNPKPVFVGAGIGDAAGVAAASVLSRSANVTRRHQGGSQGGGSPLQWQSDSSSGGDGRSASNSDTSDMTGTAPSGSSSEQGSNSAGAGAQSGGAREGELQWPSDSSACGEFDLEPFTYNGGGFARV